MSDEHHVSRETARAMQDKARDAERDAEKARERAEKMEEEADPTHGEFSTPTEEKKREIYRARHHADDLRLEASNFRRMADNTLRESILNPDFTPDPSIESVLPDLKKSTYKTAVVAGVALTAVVAIGFLLFKDKDASTEVEEDSLSSAVEQGDDFAYENKTYYQVFADKPEENSGTEVCAKHGMKCVGYTAHTTAVCMAYHPGAQPSQDFNGSKAGFYCNGAPQGGICAKELNTCHICPECNLNMECDTQIGDLYRETFVECAPRIEIPAKTGM